MKGECFTRSSACGRGEADLHGLAGMMPRKHPSARPCNVHVFPAVVSTSNTLCLQRDERPSEAAVVPKSERL